ncbi:GDSL esterase/lipase At1g29670 [Ziziphus jujuba]|uniref:GDSL esterase/lipase At1g29670 n=1 Tax=Ziziphus jujuba TaxID=326968 RepID=A0A6P3ZWP6_ZIZJJ|nr:GDSL esterase/lipase At1g29670 [Ziziphus jujuba]
MARENSSFIPLFLLFLSLFLCFFPYNCCCSNNNGVDQIKGMFVFGSSLVDNGNNNFILDNSAKANYFPYGIDFPFGPTGRFTNGKNVIDLLCERLMLPFIPRFADPLTRGSKIIHGVNFASAASGILDSTGLIAGNVITLNEQMRNFEEVTLPELEAQLGCKSAQSLPQYLFVVGTGGNDYSFNYFLNPNGNTSLEAFTANLTLTLSQKIKRLYSLGGRTFIVISINPIGCSPMIKINKPTQSGCVEEMNRAAQLFNRQLMSFVDSSKQEMPFSTLVFVNSYQILNDILQNPSSQGFEEASRPCCEVPSLSEGGNGVLCKRGGQACENRRNHVYFDGLHPSEAVNIQIATKAFLSPLKTEVYPINIKQLANIV